MRAIAVLKPAGTVEALVAYLPTAEDDQVLEEVSSALVTTAAPTGKSDPAIVKALTDDVPIRRAVAAEVLAQVGGDEQRPAGAQAPQRPQTDRSSPPPTVCRWDCWPQCHR